MRAKSMALILVALACGLVATIGVSQVMKKNSQNESIALGPIVVTLANMDIGQSITPEAVELEQWPMDRIPPGAVTAVEEVEGKYARQYMFAGEPLMAGKLMDQNTDQEAAKIPPGFRVAAVKVDEASAVANLINPGDHVDVIAFIKSRSSADKVRSKTILRDIRVFAVNSETSRAQELGEEGRIDAKTVSLLVKPKQVQLLVLAEQLGKLELSLRHPDETLEDLDETTTVDDLLGETSGSGDGSSNKPSGSWLDLLKPKSQPSNQGEAADPDSLDKPFEMVVMGPDNAVKWKWNDEGELPELVGDSGARTEGAETPATGQPVELPPGLTPAPITPVPPAPPAPDSAFLGEA